MARLLEESLSLGRLPRLRTGENKEERNRKWKEYESKMDALQEISDNLPAGEIKGGVLSFGVADGAAYYLVVKVRPLTLQHIDYIDGYHVHYALIKGLDRSDIEYELASRRKLDKLFARVRV